MFKVDTRGIPREAELWNKVQSSVTSQQSRAAMRDQIGACFQELQSGRVMRCAQQHNIKSVRAVPESH